MRPGIARLAAVTAMGFLLYSLPAAAAPYTRLADVALVSRLPDGSAAGAPIGTPDVTRDGRYVAFETEAALLPEDQNASRDIYVYDRTTGKHERVSLDSQDREVASFFTGYPDISADGRYVAFSSFSPFTPNANPHGFHTYIRDRVDGTTELATTNANGVAVNGGGDSHISDDGRFVSFCSGDSNVVPGDTNQTYDVFVKDRQTGAVERVSVSSAEAQASNESCFNTISSDGSRVAFMSLAANLVPEDTTPFDIFVRDRDAGTTDLVSVSSAERQGNASSVLQDISADGRFVAFASYASNLVPGDASPLIDIFVRDLDRGTTERVHVAPDGTDADGSAFAPAISPDGRYVTFTSTATNLVEGDTNGKHDHFLHDRLTGSTERISVAADGSQTNDAAGGKVVMSAEARVLAFASSSALVPADQNSASDVYLRDRGPELGAARVQAARTTEGVRVSGWATHSGTELIAAADPSGDGAPLGPVTAHDLGADLVAARLGYRPDSERLRIRWQVTGMPSVAPPRSAAEVGIASVGLVPGVALPAGVVYGLELRANGTRYEVRGVRVGATNEPAAPLFAVFRCDPGCTQVTRVRGAIGTTGDEAVAEVPLAALGVEPGLALTDLRAFTALGRPDTLPERAVDEAALPAFQIPARSIAVAVGPSEGHDADTAYEPVPPGDGRFSVVVPGSGTEPLVASVRVCLGHRCKVSSVSVA